MKPTALRSLCEELTEYVSLLDDPPHDLVIRAQAFLQKNQGVTKAELRQVFDDQSGYINDEQVMWWPDFHKAARVVLERWSNDYV